MRRVLPWIWGIVGVLLIAVVWEVYKLVGPSDGWVVGAIEGKTGSGLRLLPRTTDINMPHVWSLVTRLFEPVGGPSSPPLWQPVGLGLAVTLGIAALGLAIGLVVGFVFALLMQRWRIVEWGLLPWIIVSQTVPLIAFAPIVARIGNQIERMGVPWPDWLSVALIASYLAFFPVAVGLLRGLESPSAIHLDLLRSYAASNRQVLRRLRLPASVPYLLPALRLAAVNAVVGAIVAEVSIGMQGGLGRLIVTMAGSASGDPALPWGPIIGAMLLGFLAAGSVALLGRSLGRYRRAEAVA